MKETQTICMHDVVVGMAQLYGYVSRDQIGDDAISTRPPRQHRLQWMEVQWPGS